MPVIKTEEQRRAWNEYTRSYRAQHPEKVQEWRLRQAERLLAKRQQEQRQQGQRGQTGGGGDEHAGD